MTRPIRVLLADDHATVRDALAILLNGQTDMDVVGTAGDGEEAVQKACELVPDVAVLDVSMPVLNGARAAQAIHDRCPSIKLVALTRHSEDAYVQSLLRAGVSGYVLKQSASAELVQAIRAVTRGGTYVDPALAKGGSSRRVRTTDRTNRSLLTAREEQVLKRVAWGYSNKDIAAELEISVKTVEIHKANAMRRLELANRIEIMRFAMLQGWLRDA